MPNSVKVGDRPSIRSTRWYSSVVSPCSAMSAGVIAGSPGRGSGVTCLWVVEDLENVVHEAAERTARFVNVPEQTNLPLVHPDAVTFGTHVDFHILKIALRQIAATPRALHVMLAARDLATLLVEERTHLSNQLSALTRKVLVCIARWMVFRVTMHDPSPSKCLINPDAAASSL